MTTLTGGPGSSCSDATPSSSSSVSIPRSSACQARLTVILAPGTTTPSGVVTRTNMRLLKPATRPSPSSVTAVTAMPSADSSTAAVLSTRSPAGSIAATCAVSVAWPCRSSGISGSFSSKRPLAPAFAVLGSTLSIQAVGGGQSPLTPQVIARSALATGAPEL